MDPGTILAAAAPSLVDGLFGLFGGSESTTVNYKALRKNAEKGGFNPLTALRGGGSAGFVKTHSPAMASLGTMAKALAAGYQTDYFRDPRAEETAELERQVMAAQLKNIESGTRLNEKQLSAPARVAGSRSRPLRDDPNPGVPDQPGRNPTMYTTPAGTDGTGWWHSDPDAPDTEYWEDRYGDFLGGIIGGTITAGRDTGYNIRRAYEWGKANTTPQQPPAPMDWMPWEFGGS